MASVEKYTLRELDKKIKEGEKYRFFKPFTYNGQLLFNVEKILTEKDIMRLDGKIYGPVEVVKAVEHNTDDSSRSSVVENCVKILKTSPLFRPNDTHHLDFTKRKECEKLFDGIINGNPHLAQKMLELYEFSKKLFVHSVNVTIISLVVDLGLQEKRKQHNALRSEELLTGALLHDIGFLNLPKSMVEKRRLDYDDNEKKLFFTYPDEGKKIVKSLAENVRSRSLDIVYQHQERVTGTGFPQHLKGDKIEETALIVDLLMSLIY